MADSEWFKDPVNVGSQASGWYVNGAQFPAKDWSMEIVFTRKVKPVAVGTLIICTQPSPHSLLRLAERFEDGWKTFFPANNAADWTGTLEEQDELARRCWRPITDAEWEED